MTTSPFEIFFYLSSDPMVVAGTDGYFKRVNPAFVELLGYDEGELLSKPYYSFMHPKDVDRSAREVQNLAAGSSTLNFENRFRRKDGTYRLLSWTSPAPQSDDSLMYAAARDITEERNDSAQGKVERSDFDSNRGSQIQTRADTGTRRAA